MLATALKSTAVAALVTLGSFAAMPAHAGDFVVGFSFGEVEPAGYRGRGYHGRKDYRRDVRRRRHGRRGCRPGRALRKARAIGVRNARIVDVGPRGTIIFGRRWGQPVRVGIGRVRGCPIVYANRRYH